MAERPEEMEFRSGLLVQSSEVVLEWWMALCRSALHPIGLDHFYGTSQVPDAKTILGAVAQLGERLICIQEVAGSIPTSSTSSIKHGPVAQLVRAHP
jgi:hypothetical protein